MDQYSASLFARQYISFFNYRGNENPTVGEVESVGYYPETNAGGWCSYAKGRRFVRALGSSRESRSLGYLATLRLGGCIALGAVTATCVILNQEESTAGFFLLVAVVLLSLLDSFISSVIFSVVGAALLNYFFAELINSFGIRKTADLFSLVAFLVTSLAITTLVRRIGRVEKTQRAQAQLLELTHDIIIVRDKKTGCAAATIAGPSAAQCIN
ncbi:DUF4118 domain-containing protein [Paraburkholderia sediminicola]|uniref:DUF4118 domain-containing protein n=1 Tax=Paraburkholderia rhynchosiae TaxID=487049 RepID=A0ACC7NPH0_9BURK